MADPLLSLAPSDLRALASAIRAGRITPPYTRVALERYLHGETADLVANSLQAIANVSMAAPIAHTLDLLSEALAERAPISDFIDLVTTSPDSNGVVTRDTCVVVSELFRNAHRSVLLAGYAVYQGQKVFEALASRMEEVPTLAVRLYLDIQRRPADTSAESEIVCRFIHQFRTTQWPAGKRMPEIYYYPASLAHDWRTGAALHAKCIVVDHKSVYVSSANFTEAAQQRNIEVGVLVHSADFADRVVRFFSALVDSRELVPATTCVNQATLTADQP